MSSFYIEGLGVIGASAQLQPEEARHASQVLRLRPGDEVSVIDGSHARFSAVIMSIEKNDCIVQIQSSLPNNESPLKLTLYQGLPKAEKFELIVQKLTELGALRIVPVKMDRCVVKLNDKDAAKRLERMERIAKEASKQCRRSTAPDISVPFTWKQLADQMASHDLLLVPWEDATGYGMKNAAADFPNALDIGIVIGPEGGMSTEEVDALRALGARTMTLGPRILRTETAALAACTMAMTLWGDIG